MFRQKEDDHLEMDVAREKKIFIAYARNIAVQVKLPH